MKGCWGWDGGVGEGVVGDGGYIHDYLRRGGAAGLTLNHFHKETVAGQNGWVWRGWCWCWVGGGSVVRAP